MALISRLAPLVLSAQALWAQYVIGTQAGTVNFITFSAREFFLRLGEHARIRMAEVVAGKPR